MKTNENINDQETGEIENPIESLGQSDLKDKQSEEDIKESKKKIKKDSVVESNEESRGSEVQEIKKNASKKESDENEQSKGSEINKKS